MLTDNYNLPETKLQTFTTCLLWNIKIACRLHLYFYLINDDLFINNSYRNANTSFDINQIASYKYDITICLG